MIFGIQVEIGVHLDSLAMRENGSASSLTVAGMICIEFTSGTEKDPTLGGRIEVKQGLSTEAGVSIMCWLMMPLCQILNTQRSIDEPAWNARIMHH